MIYFFLANGFEEIEGLAPVDVLRRSGISVQTVGVGEKTVTGSHGIPVVCDILDSEISLDDSLQGIFLPGGMPGTLNLEKSENVNRAIDYCIENNLLVSAICAAPSILGHKGLLKNKKAICFPGFEAELEGAALSDDFVCEDGNILTAKGMGSAVEFGLRIAEYLTDKSKADKIRSTLQIYDN